MGISEYTDLITKGLLNNCIMVLCACILPLMFGVGLSFLANVNGGLRKLVKTVSNVFESMSFIFLIIILYYCVFWKYDSSLFVCIIGLTISHLGYISARLNQNCSIWKNIAVNSVGLLSSLFKWSLCVGYIGTRELCYSLNIIRSTTFEANVFWIGLLISFAIIFILRMIRLVLEETMK